MNQLEISPAVSQATTAAARWFDHHRNRYKAEDEDLFDALLRLVETPLHLCTLSEELERRMLARDAGPRRQPTPHAGALTRSTNPAPNPSNSNTRAR